MIKKQSCPLLLQSLSRINGIGRRCGLYKKPYSLLVFGAILPGAVDLTGASTANTGDFLEIKCLDECDELVLRVFNRIVDESVCEKNRVVGHLDLSNCFSDTDLELLLCLNSVTDATSKLIEAWRIDEQEVALKSLSINFFSTFDIYFDDRNLA